MIRTSLRLYKSKIKRDGRSFSLRFIFYSQLKTQIKLFKNVNKQADSHTLPATTLISNMKEKHKEDMETIKEAYDECP